MHHYMSHCPCCCPPCQHEHYTPHYQLWRHRQASDYEREGIKGRIEMLKDELKALEGRLEELEHRNK